MTTKDPSFLTGVGDEIALVKPSGVIEFWQGFKKVNEVTFSSEAGALNFAKSKGWKEVPLAV